MKELVLTIFLSLLVTSSLQFGVVYVDQINGNRDLHYVGIENVQILGGAVTAEYVEGLTTNGVVVSLVSFLNGNENVPGNIAIQNSALVEGLLSTNGGIDIGPANGTVNFMVDAQSGNTLANGLSSSNGINVSNGAFLVDKLGDVSIASATLNPNGGIESEFFNVDATSGNTTTDGNLYVYGNIIIGDTTKVTRSVLRIPSVGNYGGSTYLSGQASNIQGGDLYMEPGYGSSVSTAGNILLGRSNNDNIYFGRVPIQNKGGFAGDTTISGQSSSSGNGGNIYLVSGSSTGAFSGADIFISPGYSNGNGDAGQIILGTNDCISSTCNDDLTVTRVNSGSASAGDLTFQGQSSASGNGGDFTIRTGRGSTTAGNLFLVPGISGGASGSIILGTSFNNNLYFTRVTTPSSAGPLLISAQSANNGAGGSLHLKAGDDLSSTIPGNLYIEPGVAANPDDVFNIIIGSGYSDLIIERLTGGTTPTLISGQNSLSGPAGDLVFTSGGSGISDAGSLNIQAGFAGPDMSGGSLNITAGASFTSTAGSFYVTAGNGGTSGGNIVLTAGDDNSNQGGNVYIQTGGSTSSILVTSASILEFTEGLTISNGHSLIINSGSSCTELDPIDCVTQPSLEIQTPSSSSFGAVVSFLDPTVSTEYRRLIGNSLVYVPPPISPAAIQVVDTRSSTPYSYFGNLRTQIAQAQSTLVAMVDALGQCGHGLIQVSLVDGTNAYSACDPRVTMAPSFVAPFSSFIP